jgi:hypothetical protein
MKLPKQKSLNSWERIGVGTRNLESRLQQKLALYYRPGLKHNFSGVLMNHNLKMLLLFAVMISTLACTPKIVSFEASPILVCEGQSTRVSWKARGSTVLLSNPILPGTGAVESTGFQRFTPTGTTIFTIKAAGNGREAFLDQVVVSLPSRTEREIVINVKPSVDGVLVGVETIKQSILSDFKNIETIRGDTDRPITVLHEGREVILQADGVSSEGMRGTGFSGYWEIRAEPLPGEEVGDPAHAPPDNFRLLVSLSCSGQRK